MNRAGSQIAGVEGAASHGLMGAGDVDGWVRGFWDVRMLGFFGILYEV